MRGRLVAPVAVAGVLAAAALVTTLVPASSAARPARATGRVPFTARDLAGEFRGGCAGLKQFGEGFDRGAFTRSYVQTATNSVVRYTLYADARCTRPLFSFRVFAYVELGRPRPALGPTREALVLYDRVLVTAESRTGLQVVRSCGVPAVGVEHEVTDTGCAPLGIRPHAECLGDYDLLRLDRRGLTAGFRTPNMCTAAGRPRRTQTVFARRVN